MAGAGYKLFNTGDVLTAAQVNTYLQQQVTMVFANATARTTALSGVLAEGMMSYLQDTNAVEVYDGSNWVSVGNTGDITGVTAGTGLTGGGTSGTVTLTNDMATTITTKGDLVVGTGAGTYARLAAGTNNYTLVADSSETTGLKWAAPAGGGKVLQVIHGTTSTAVASTTNTYVDTNLTATITPSSTNSKVLVFVTQAGLRRTNTGYDQGVRLRLLRNGTTVFNQGQMGMINSASTLITLAGYSHSFNYLDSPASTSALTYKTQMSAATDGDRVDVNYQSFTSGIVLMEIGA